MSIIVGAYSVFGIQHLPASPDGHVAADPDTQYSTQNGDSMVTAELALSQTLKGI